MSFLDDLPQMLRIIRTGANPASGWGGKLKPPSPSESIRFGHMADSITGKDGRSRALT